MIALRYAYLTALVVWLGGMIVLGVIVAPATFDVLQRFDSASGRELAGAVFGETVRRFHYLAYLAGIALVGTLAGMRLLGPRPRSFGIRMTIAGVMLAVTLYAGLVLTNRIQALQGRGATAVTRLAPDDPRRIQFGRLHGLSTALIAINIAGGLALLFWEARSS